MEIGDTSVSTVTVSNIESGTTEEEIIAFFGLAATPFLKQHCKVLYSESNNSARVTAPSPVVEEITKLHEHEYKGKKLTKQTT